ncbi:hybrid sensor histidine kinase/response regulator [Taibaiella lutea]|uniref:histidine kinase n=1 Tax=Taibaiella lutea TaxID=2608001 RepID=A0A5M6CFC7_9BACT|nr:hybrid sensor histidine kinase/response regulator [Taibaiella lutea]KAA5532155.1 hybrid sensor histidine kinase/response regulator [Taibaiella lutea]
MILIVDDKIENITALKKVLESHNFVVDTALSGQEALKKILRQSYQLIILDVQMPDMDGFEVAESISGFSKTNDIPIIFLSAVNISKEFITKGYASGGHDYLVKPFDPDILVLKIRTFIKLYEQTLELSKMQQVLIDEIEQRKRAEQKKDEFLSIASHELKTPLTSVKGYIQLAEMSVQSNEKENALNFINRSSNQLKKLDTLITELLDISKMTTGNLEYHFADFNFEPFLDNVIDVILRSNPGRNIIRSGYADFFINGDEFRLEQVLLNYLSNAIKYSTEPHPILIHVETTDSNEVKVSVRDSGIGISKADQSNLFGKFYRAVQSSSKYQGFGMGLYICAEIIEKHGGTYGVESEPDKGSTFHFTLPLTNKNHNH